MRLILVAVGISLAVSILLTPVLIRLFTKQGFGQEIREDGPPSHQTKRGTPSMGGVAIVAGIWAGYLVAQLVGSGEQVNARWAGAASDQFGWFAHVPQPMACARANSAPMLRVGCGFGYRRLTIRVLVTR